MAFLPSDDIWEKFDLAGTCVSSNEEFDLEAIMDETFADLGDFAQDFGITEAPSALDDPFSVKEEPADMFGKQIGADFMIKEEIFQMNEDDSSCDFLNDLNLPSMDLSALEPDTLKSDCMWSSTLPHQIESQQQQQQQNKGRKRDFSLTLSECNEGMMAIKDIEILGTSPPTFLGGSLLTGASLNPFIETPLTTSASESDTESTSTDEEIDVVSSDDNDMYRHQLVQQQHHHHHRVHNSSSKKIPHIEAGRSLLLSRNRSPKPVHQQQESAQNASYCQQTFIDHSYFLVRPPSPKRGTNGMIQGMLTPTESSDDDESISTQFISSNVSGNIDKRKIVQAVQSLIKNNKQSLLNCANKRAPSSDNIKFKFRMKFKSSSQQHSLLSVNNRHQIKRKSATNNFHCPSPSTPAGKSQDSVSILNSNQRSMTSTPSSPSKPGQRNVKSSRTSSSSSGSSSRRSSPNNHEQKCREIRDLHNSMERQRRVDLRKNFDQLKSVVPELADTEKASKLNILNKASDYCKLLASLDVKLRKDVEKESSRNALLRKKLAALQSQFSSGGVRLSSGRVSLVHGRR